MAGPLRVLIVDDEPDLRELLGLYLGYNLEVVIQEAGSGTDAIEAVKRAEGQFDLVISDFTMPNGNGGVLESFLRQSYPNIPFLLVSGGPEANYQDLLRNAGRLYLGKPYSESDLNRKVLALVKKQDDLLSNPDYVQVSTAALLKIRAIEAPLYLRLGPSNYVKVVPSKSLFTEESRDHYLKKGVSALFVKREDYAAFFKVFRQRVHSDMVLSNLKQKKAEALKLSKSIQEVVQLAVQSFQLSPEVIELGNHNIELVQNVVSSTDSIRNIFSWFDDDNSEALLRGIVLCYLLTALTRDVQPENPRAQEILALASFFHDISLEDDHIFNKERYIKGMNLHTGMNREQIERIRQHPIDAAVALQNWQDCPPNLIQIIHKHHELPDGSGFPHKITGADMDELTAIFIVAQRLSEIFIRTRNLDETKREFMSQAGIFLRHPTARAFEVALKQLG